MPKCSNCGSRRVRKAAWSTTGDHMECRDCATVLMRDGSQPPQQDYQPLKTHMSKEEMEKAIDELWLPKKVK